MSTATRNLSLRGLRTFCIAAEHESFRDAADRLFVTASAVSHQIKNLEDELGKPLFERRARSLVLTDAGRALYEDVSPLITRLDNVTLRHRQAVGRSTLSISVQPFFASELFVPRLPDFRLKHPEIDIRIEASDESVEKHSHKTDVSIRIFRSPPQNLVAEPLFPLRLVPAGTPDFRDELRVRRKKITSDFPLIVHESRPKAWRQWQKSAGIELPQDASSLRLDSMIAVVRAAERGLGAALIPIQLSESWFSSGSLVPLFRHQLTTNESYYFVCTSDIADQPNVRLLRAWVLQNFEDSS